MISGKSLTLFLAGIMVSLRLSGADFPAYDIPAGLKENAVAVVRLYEQNVEIKRNHDAVVNVHEVVTVLRSSGGYIGYNYLFYDKFSKITSVKATMYDALGNKVEKFNKADFTDRSAVSGISIFDDNRVMFLRPEHHSLPYTIEYEYTIEHKQSLFYPRWFPQPSEDVSVQEARLNVLAPGKEYLRYHELNLPEGSTVKLTTEKGDLRYSWEVKDVRAYREEEMSPPYVEYTPAVITGPNDFEMDGYRGNMSTWKDFGKWILTLNEGRDELPPETVAEVKKLVADTDDPREKIRRVYRYMQDRTRYVSIQVGIGGFQPFTAMEVDRNSYGDCKALSNYTYALLKAVGIPSYYTLIRAGSEAERMNPEFPSSSFNHAILCVPVASDTIWLECTSQTNPMGYTGTFTSDRDVLVINETGGHVVHTNFYSAEENVLSRRATVTLEPDGHATAEVVSDYRGIHYSKRAGAYHTGSQDERAKLLYDAISIPNFSIRGFELEESGDICPQIEETLQLELPSYASKSGSRLFVPLRLINGYDWDIEDTGLERRTDIDIRYNYTYVDTIRYKVPQNFYAEAVPFEEESFETEFGTYHSTVTPDEDGLIYTRRFEVKKGRYSPEQYADLREFFKNVSKADRAKAVMVDKS
ncbi:DUF3857 domain-containing transglutaminase family protein [Roseivirga sp. BDSF3-8]|uniref:DUF3857 domain-containing transglutaminase family protein n=1 Tax=Roseivirga sp. BDSF3-8 TaxID=3241598 RepID=UPI003531900E